MVVPYNMLISRFRDFEKFLFFLHNFGLLDHMSSNRFPYPNLVSRFLYAFSYSISPSRSRPSTTILLHVGA